MCPLDTCSIKKGGPSRFHRRLGNHPHIHKFCECFRLNKYVLSKNLKKGLTIPFGNLGVWLYTTSYTDRNEVHIFSVGCYCYIPSLPV